MTNWGLCSLKISRGFLGEELQPKDPNRAATWEVSVRLLSRTSELPAVQALLRDHTRALAHLAQVEDLTALDDGDN